VTFDADIGVVIVVIFVASGVFAVREGVATAALTDLVVGLVEAVDLEVVGLVVEVESTRVDNERFPAFVVV
jgi:hypothetical protein